MKKICSVEKCNSSVLARGWCKKHYDRWYYSGRVYSIKRPYGSGGPNWFGYWRIQVNGTSVKEHRFIAEKVLGKKLPDNAVIHHFDGNPQNNSNNNLIICQDEPYHNFLHKRTKAYQMTGNAHYEWCWLCKKHDDPKHMHKDINSYYHPICRKIYDQKRWRDKHEQF